LRLDNFFKTFMATQYYYQPANEALDAVQIERRVGIDPTTYGSAGLTALGIYPVTEVVQPFNTTLYTVALTYTINGANADETWTPTAKTLADVQPLAIVQCGQTTAGRIKNLREESGYGARVFLAVSGLTNANRPAPFQAWMTRQQATVTELGANIVTITGAANVDAVNDVASAAWGCINIGYDPASPLDLLASGFAPGKFYSKNFAAADLELYFPQTTTTVAYSGGFAATASAFTSIDHSVQLRIAATGFVIDEFCVPASATVVEKEFGYKKYLGLGTEY
jgi:hypothetical protein